MLLVAQSAFAAAPAITVDPAHKFLLLQQTDSSSKIPLNLPTGTTLDGKPLYFAAPDFGLIEVAVADGPDASTLLFAVDGKGRQLWTLDLESFNASAPLIEADFVYISVTDKVFKLEKKTGKIVWKHDGLLANKKYEFNGAEAIVRKGDVIVFSKKVHVKDKTGALAEVSL